MPLGPSYPLTLSSLPHLLWSNLPPSFLAYFSIGEYSGTMASGTLELSLRPSPAFQVPGEHEHEVQEALNVEETDTQA